MPSSNPEHTDELSIIGYSEPVELTSIVEGGFIYIHKACYEWSPPAETTSPLMGVNRNEENLEYGMDDGIKTVVAVALQRKCSFCSRYGASISCKVCFLTLSMTSFTS